jgi:purine-cytosine permease-like protein
MQALLALLIVIVAVLGLRASNAIDIVIVVAILVPACLLFWKLVKAMARIQMQERR